MMSLPEHLWCSITRSVAEKFPELAAKFSLNSADDNKVLSWLTEEWTETDHLDDAVLMLANILMTAVNLKVFPARKIAFEICDTIANKSLRLFSFYVIAIDATTQRCLTASNKSLGKFVFIPHPATLEDYEKLTSELAAEML